VSIPIVIAKNPTGGDIYLSRLGVTVPAGNQETLCGVVDAPASFYEVCSDDSLIAQVTAGNIVINDGTSDLATNEALAYLDASGNMNGPVTGAAANKLLRLLDTSGRYTEVTDQALWPSGAADPVGAPGDGDLYYNTALDMLMAYDAGRGKWLSTEGDTFQVGQNGNVPVGTYYKGVAGKTLSATLGYVAPFNGTVISMSFSMTTAVNTDFEAMASGVQIEALNTGGAATGYSTSLDGDFSQGDVLAVMNDATGAQTRDAQCWVRMKWRA